MPAAPGFWSRCAQAVDNAWWTDYAAHRVAHRTSPSPTSSTGCCYQFEIDTQKANRLLRAAMPGYDPLTAGVDPKSARDRQLRARQHSQPPQPHIEMPLQTYFTSHRRNRSDLLGNRWEFLIMG